MQAFVYTEKCAGTRLLLLFPKLFPNKVKGNVRRWRTFPFSLSKNASSRYARAGVLVVSKKK